MILAKPDNCEAEVYLLEEFPIPDPNRSLVSKFMCIKTRFVEQQLAQIGLKVASPKILKPSLADDPCRPLKTRLTGLRKMKYYNDLRDDEDRASRAIKEANRVLANPLEPPGEGQLFKPLDLAFLWDSRRTSDFSDLPDVDTQSEWARLLGIRPSVLARAEHKGKLSGSRPKNARTVFYSKSEILRWIGFGDAR